MLNPVPLLASGAKMFVWKGSIDDILERTSQKMLFSMPWGMYNYSLYVVKVRVET